MAAKTLFEKIWEEHVVREKQHEPSLLYIDLHLVHEVTSPQAFEGLRHSGRKVRAPHRTVRDAGSQRADHRPQQADHRPRFETADRDAAAQLRGVRHSGCSISASREQGIVHVIGPELGLTQPGMTIVCGDSHTATHGAFGALAFGIGTSEVEHVLATQCLWEERPQTFEIRVDGKLGTGVGAKDLILGIIGRIRTDGATGHVIEYRGAAVEALSMEERMTVCNMSIEGGARAGMVAADKTTVEYLRGRRYIPSGKEFDKLAARWLECRSDDGAKFDRSVVFDAATFAPQVTWGTNPGMVTDVRGSVPNPAGDWRQAAARDGRARAHLHGAAAGNENRGHQDRSRVYRIVHQLAAERSQTPPVSSRAAKSRRPCTRWWCRVRRKSRPRPRVSGSTEFSPKPASSGASRDAACASAMNPDVLQPGERCASTSNRNFEGRQGKGGRTHLVSPAMAAAAAIAGHFVDVREWANR